MVRPLAIAISLQPLAIACGGHSVAPVRPNVLLITIDTFRADRVGIGLTPAIDRLAASGLRFTAAHSAVPLTLPSHTTILTGLLPPAHGVRANGIDTLDAKHQTVATLLKNAGYDTAAFVGAFVLDHRFGLAQGFDTYDDRIPRDPNATERLEAERPASAVVDRALAWLGAHKAVVDAASSSDHRAPSPQPRASGFTSTILTRRTRRRKSSSRRDARHTTERSHTPTRSWRACSMRCARKGPWITRWS
jgi:arylsulfatase A-like enzyme